VLVDLFFDILQGQKARRPHKGKITPMKLRKFKLSL